MANLERLLELYQTGAVPWDQADPPPEVLTTAPSSPVGRALDLGRGLGRASLFMAGLGWQVDGVDFVPQAIAEATRRADQTGFRRERPVSLRFCPAAGLSCRSL